MLYGVLLTLQLDILREISLVHFKLSKGKKLLITDSAKMLKPPVERYAKLFERRKKSKQGGAFLLQPSISVHETEVFFQNSSMHHFDMISWA